MSIGPTSSRLSLSIVVVVVVVEFLASGPLVFSELCGGGVPTSAGRLRTLGFCRYAVKSLRSIPPCSLRHSPHCYSPQAHPCPYLPPPQSAVLHPLLAVVAPPGATTCSPAILLPPVPQFSCIDPIWDGQPPTLPLCSVAA